MSTSLVNLSSLEPGNLSLEVFNAVARVTVTPVIELIITDGQSVLLRSRPDTDQYWPGQYCLPGSIVYSGGPRSLEEYLGKILTSIGVSTAFVKFGLVGVEVYSTKRGDEVTIIYKVYTNIRANISGNLKVVRIKNTMVIDLIPEHKDILRKYLIG